MMIRNHYLKDYSPAKVSKFVNWVSSSLPQTEQKNWVSFIHSFSFKIHYVNQIDSVF